VSIACGDAETVASLGLLAKFFKNHLKNTIIDRYNIEVFFAVPSTFYLETFQDIKK
jgi:hypothetical protein